jgi:plasmid stabilization system protein ParE
VSFQAEKFDDFLADFDTQTLWYISEAGVEVAFRFQEAVEETILRLIENPTIGHPRSFHDERLKNLRSLTVNPPFLDS